MRKITNESFFREKGLFIRTYLAKGANMDYSPSSMVELYIDRIEKAEHLSPVTVKNRRSDLTVFARFLNEKGFDDLRKVRMSDVKDFFTLYFEGGRKRNSINTIQRHVRYLFRYLNEEEEIEFSLNPKKIKPIGEERIRKIIIPEDVIYQVLKDTDDEQLRVIIYLIFGSGFRVDELTKIKIDDINGDYITVLGKGQNGGKLADVSINHEIMCFIKNFLVRHNRTSGYLIKRLQQHSNVDPNSPVDADTIRRWLKPHFARYGYHVTPHIGRYTFATSMYLNGADLATVQVALRHENMITTQKYLHIPPTHIRETFEKCMTLRPLAY